jgi:diamine N-acetyltransferase
MDRALSFRDARADDAPELVDVARDTYTETFGQIYQPGDIRRYLDENFSLEVMRQDVADPTTEIRVAFAGRRMVGYCKLGAFALPVEPDPRPALQLHRIYVTRARQGVGVGRILLTWAIERARQRGARSLWLGVWPGNAFAIKVYESRGFEAAGDAAVQVGSTFDTERLMRLVLK